MIIICLQRIFCRKNAPYIFSLLVFHSVLGCYSEPSKVNNSKNNEGKVKEMFTASFEMFNRYGFIKEPIDILNQVSEIAPEKAYLVKLNLGFMHLKMKKVKQGIIHLKEAIKLNPDFATAHYHLGNVLLNENLIEEAIRHFEKAIKIFSRKLNGRPNPREVDGLPEDMRQKRALSYAQIGVCGDLTNDGKRAIVYTLKASMEFLQVNDPTGEAKNKALIAKKTLYKMLEKYNFRSREEAVSTFNNEIMAFNAMSQSRNN